jgi:aromatic ring-opening dioxygenase catalytic subunit (LigB family)
MGRAIGEAVSQLDRRAVVLASGGMSHTFWPLKELAEHEASDPIHIVSPEARVADEERLRWMEAGDHRRIVEEMGAYMPHNPEGDFGHYLMMLGAVGGAECTARGELFSDYENATGTGQVHVWFDRPKGGWTA